MGEEETDMTNNWYSPVSDVWGDYIQPHVHVDDARAVCEISDQHSRFLLLSKFLLVGYFWSMYSTHCTDFGAVFLVDLCRTASSKREGCDRRRRRPSPLDRF